jgi:hypothetical protein
MQPVQGSFVWLERSKKQAILRGDNMGKGGRRGKMMSIIEEFYFFRKK